MNGNSFGFKTLLLVLIILASSCGIVSALPPIPSDYSGYVKVDGEPAPDGALVYAKIEGYTSDSVIVSDGGRYRYLLVAPPDGTYNEKTIEFYVDPDAGGPIPATKAAETDTFDLLGDSHDLELTVLIVDSTLPVISSISSSEITTSGARITWTTDEPSTSQVEYGKTTSYGSQTSSPALVTSHSVTLTSLEEGTTYHFRVVSTDENTARSGDHTFTTATSSSPPPSGGGIMPSNEPPVADAGPDRTVYVDVAIHFSGAGSHDPDGTIVEYHWFPGDGSHKSGVKVIHVYEEAGNYTVSLSVTDNNGATSTDECMVTVNPMPVEPQEKAAETVPANQTGYVVDALDTANTTVTVNTTDTVTVTVIKYETNPHPGDPMPGEGIPKYADIFVSDPDAVDWPIYVEMTYTDEEIEGLDEASLGMYYWMDAAWQRCSDTGVYTERNVVWAYMTAEEAAGSPILMGGMPAIPPPPLPPILTNFTITPEEVELGGNITFRVVVTNVDAQSFVYILSLRIRDELIHLDVPLEGGVSVTWEYEVCPEAAGTYDVRVDGINGSFVVTEVYVPLPAEFEVYGLEVSPGVVSVGEDTRVTVTVANQGDLEGTHTVVLETGGAVSERLVTLEGGASAVVEFSVPGEAWGTFDVEVEGLSGSFRVLRPAEFECAGLAVDPVEVEAGGSVAVSVDVCNLGEEEGSYSVELEVDGTVAGREDLTLGGGAEATVVFQVEGDEGVHTVSVGGLEEMFTVSSPPEPGPPGLSQGLLIGGVAVVALAAGLIVFFWRGRVVPATVGAV